MTNEMGVRLFLHLRYQIVGNQNSYIVTKQNETNLLADNQLPSARREGTRFSNELFKTRLIPPTEGNTRK